MSLRNKGKNIEEKLMKNKETVGHHNAEYHIPCGSPRGEEKEAERIFENMVKNLPDLMKDMNINPTISRNTK